MIKLILISLFIPYALIFIVCDKNKDVITSPENSYMNNNLLLNSSFEINDNPSHKYWHANNPDYVYYSEDTPPEGGQWSIYLRPEWGPPTSLTQSIKTRPGNFIYNFSFFAKSEGVGGRGVLGLQNSDTLVVCKQITVNDTNWIEYTISDTISSTLWDTIFVAVNGGISQLAYGKTNFDLCKMECKIAK